MKYLQYQEDAYIGLLTIQRPEAFNSLNSDVMAELSAFLESVSLSDIRCLIITGAGEKAFVAGADIGEMASMTPEQARAFSEAGNAAFALLEALPQPTIAAINGVALGGGLELALSCDLRIASESAKFALPEVSLGIIPGYGGLQRLARLIGPGRAKQLAFTADRIDAWEAHRIGLVNAVENPENLLSAAREMAGRIARNAPFAVHSAKRVLAKSAGKEPEESRNLEGEPFARCFATQDQKEAMKAFLEKRRPAPFRGE